MASSKNIITSGTTITHAIARSSRRGNTVMVRASATYFQSFRDELIALGGVESTAFTVRGNKLYRGNDWAIELKATG